MRIINKIFVVVLFTSIMITGSTAKKVSAATSPSLGAAQTYGILSKFYVNNVPGTTINGDVGFTTGPAVVPAGTHTNYGSGAPYTTAGADQATALAALNAQACTFTFAPGAINLTVQNVGSGVGVYPPGVYCILGEGSIGGGGTITLSGAGTYIFRMTSRLTTTLNSVVALSNGASACDVWWTPSPHPALTTLWSNSVFKGTIIDSSGIRVETNVSWVGRALAFAGIVYTHIDDTITVPPMSSCPPPPPTTATLNVIKTVINNDGGTAVASSAIVSVKLLGINVAGSPSAGVGSPGKAYTLAPGTYVVSENPFPGYSWTFSGDCSANGIVTLSAGNNKTCTITNNDFYQAPSTLFIIKKVVGGTAVASNAMIHIKKSGVQAGGGPFPGITTPGKSYLLPSGTYVVSEDPMPGYTATFSGDCNSNGTVVMGDSAAPETCTITNTYNLPSPVLLKVVKIVYNTYGGTAVSSNFTIRVKHAGVDVPLPNLSPAPGISSPGRSYSLIPNTYIVSEDTFPGYTPVFTGDCAANGSITLVVGGTTKTCTVRNYQNPPSLTTLNIIKNVINDNGGTAVPSNAIIHVNTSMGPVAGSPQLGTSAPGTLYTLVAGTYTVSENFMLGYTATFSGDCSANGNITLISGGNKTCTITNNDIPVGTTIDTIDEFIPMLPDTGINSDNNDIFTKDTIRLKIPSIKVDAEVVSVGLTPSGNKMDVPKGRFDVGWYSLGTSPGDVGSAVIAGHTNWKNNKSAVFDNLHKLKKGDKVYYEDESGKIISFVVTKIKIYDRDAIVREVFKSDDGKHLNLITCAGAWDNSIKTSPKRLVVFTEIIK